MAGSEDVVIVPIFKAWNVWLTDKRSGTSHGSIPMVSLLTEIILKVLIQWKTTSSMICLKRDIQGRLWREVWQNSRTIYLWRGFEMERSNCNSFDIEFVWLHVYTNRWAHFCNLLLQLIWNLRWPYVIQNGVWKALKLSRILQPVGCAWTSCLKMWYFLSDPYIR